MDDLFDGNELKTFSAVLNKLQGSYAIAMLTYDGKIYAAKKDSPLVIGLSRSETYVSSDLTAFSDKTDKFVIMEDEIAEISDTVSFFSDGKKYSRKYSNGNAKSTLATNPFIRIIC